jgi:hypothetical protein
MSLGEINVAISATNEGLSHLEEVTQAKSDETFVVMTEKIPRQVDYRETITRQALDLTEHIAMINSQKDANTKLNECLIISDRKAMLLEKQVEIQRFLISKLKYEVREKEMHIAQLNAKIEQKNESIVYLTESLTDTDEGTASPRGEDIKDAIEEIKELLAELKRERNLKRKHDDE